MDQFTGDMYSHFSDFSHLPHLSGQRPLTEQERRERNQMEKQNRFHDALTRFAKQTTFKRPTKCKYCNKPYKQEMAFAYCPNTPPIITWIPDCNCVKRPSPEDFGLPPNEGLADVTLAMKRTQIKM
jgi:hypothetical protein